MNIKKILLDTKLFSIFIFILIVSANFLAEIFPCRLQYLLRNNMLIKHVFGLFTMIFFVVLSSGDKKILNIIKNSVLLYILFILISKCNLHIFYLILFLLGITYILNIMNDEKKINEEISNEEISNEELSNEEISNEEISNEDIYENIIYFLYVIIFILVFIGVLVYMGEKKIEYKDKFTYYTFFIGKSICKGKSPKVNIIKSLKAHLDY